MEVDTAEQLRRVTAALDAAEERPGQLAMAEAVTEAIASSTDLVVQAGTGTGKSLAYLVPAVLSGRRVVVATATKALQDQLAGKDLPFLEQHLTRPFRWSVLKGRSNYLCLQRLDELRAGADQLELDGLGADAVSPAALAQLADWAATTDTGDRADLPVEPPPRTWAAVSVGPRECPGAQRCAAGARCFAERARAAATTADVVVVNTHLYGMHLATGGALLPEHDLVVIDEAHQLEDTISATAGLELAPGRFAALARTVGALVDDPQLAADLAGGGDRLAAALADHEGRRLRRIPPELTDALVLCRTRVATAAAAVRAVPDDRPEVADRRLRATVAAGSLADDLDRALDVPDGDVAWVERSGRDTVLRLAPLEVGELLGPALFDRVTVVLTSATIPPALPERLGMVPGSFTALDVGSPFDYASQALLYCAAHLPDPGEPGNEEGVHDELVRLIEAAGGRTLGLFTSYRAMHAAAEAVRARVPHPVLVQDDLPKQALVRAFAEHEATCLFATMGFWQGIDVPGPSLSVVAIDRIPFPRPDEPLLQARRERARAEAFRLVDLPRAVTLLAQGAGRLVRSRSDRGVVAVLDPRLANRKRYRWDLVRALPPMGRTRDPEEAVSFLSGTHGR